METPRVERYSDGDVILTEGILSRKAYIVLSGEVAIAKKVGNRNVTVNVLGKGDIFGEMGLFQEQPRSATVTARGDVSVGIIDKEQFDIMLAQCPDDMKKIIDSLVDRLRKATDKLAGLGVKLDQARRSIDSFTSKEDSD